MSENTNYFAMEEELNEFQMWQGLRGPYYTPSVSPDGELTWTNNGSLPNPGPVDLTGPAGKSAYEAAQEGGYQGTEAEFNEALAEIDTALQPSDVDSQLSGSSENPVQNKVIYDALQNIHIDVDDELSDSSENPVQNKVIYNALQNIHIDVDDELSVTSENPAQNKVITLALNRKAGMLVDSVSGAIASFVPDATIPDLLGVSVAVEPVQDLHGYSNPWPAGGGKNKLPNISLNTTEENFSIVGEKGVYTVNATVTDYSKGITTLTEFTLPAGTYTLSAVKSAQETLVYVILYASDGISQIASVNSQPSTFTLSEATAIRFGINVMRGTVSNLTVRPMIEVGSTATEYAPVENICPISVWSEVGIVADGANLYPVTTGSYTYGGITFTFANGEIHAEGTATGRTDIVPITGEYGTGTNLLRLPAGTYTISVSGLSSGMHFIYGGSYSGVPYGDIAADGTATFTREVAGGTGYNVLRIDSGTTVNTTVRIQFERGSQATAFKSFAGNTYTIQIGQTVASGTIDSVAGTMTIDSRLLVYSSALYFGTFGDDNKPLYYCDIPNHTTLPIRRGTSKYETPLVSNYFKFTTAVVDAGLKDNEIRTQNGTPPARIYFRADEFADINAVNAAFATTPLQVLAKLVNPITIQLDPVTIATISGQTNNVWSDAGNVTVKFAADLKAYIDRLNHPTEDDMIANTLIAANKYFTVNNRLFISTASIAAGAQIIPGTNCTETSLAAALNALNA